MSDAKHHQKGIRTCVRLLLLAACIPSGCKPAPKTTASPPAANPLAGQLAGARFDMAQVALEKNRRDEALLLLVSSLKADPAFPDALKSIREILAETRWFFPQARLDLELPVEQLAVSGNSLWASVSGGSDPQPFNTTVRWNLATPAIEAVLFPRRGETTRALILSPDARHLIVQRGSGENTLALLCDPKTLRPIANLGSYPEQTDTRSLTAFSADGLLLAQPAPSNKGWLWHIRDAATGEIVRSAEQPEPSALSVELDRERLKIHRAEGGIFQIPVSPVDPPELFPAEVTPLSPPAISVGEHTVAFPGKPIGSIRSDLEITTAIEDGGRLFIGTREGTIEIHRLLPHPKTTGRDVTSAAFDPSRLAALAALAEALTGLAFNENTRTFSPLGEARRRTAMPARGLERLLDGLDFTPLRDSIIDSQSKPVSVDPTFLLRDRLARADNDRPHYLALKASDQLELSPQDQLRQAFQTADPEEVISIIRQIPAKNPAAATAFQLALDSNEPRWVAACLESSPEMPGFLQKLGQSRIAWLEGNKPAALAIWREGFPDLETARRTQDWDGWESVDFEASFTAMKSAIHQELATYQAPAGSQPEERQTKIQRLLDPQTSTAIGRDRHAAACLAAAEETAGIAGQDETVAKLAKLARELGAEPAACYRAEAVSAITNSDFAKAHELWISLISDFPVKVQQSRDYAEAAYTAFESGNNEQAMSILGTGITHFPNDTDFAYRAGWISLLTAHYPEAYEFLMKGEVIGFPEEKLEKATALLAIASAAVGATEDAENFHRLLLEINPSWAEEDPPKAAEWPGELKAWLRQISEPPKAIPVEELPPE